MTSTRNRRSIILLAILLIVYIGIATAAEQTKTTSKSLAPSTKALSS